MFCLFSSVCIYYLDYLVCIFMYLDANGGEEEEGKKRGGWNLFYFIL